MWCFTQLCAGAEADSQESPARIEGCIQVELTLVSRPHVVRKNMLKLFVHPYVDTHGWVPKQQAPNTWVYRGLYPVFSKFINLQLIIFEQ